MWTLERLDPSVLAHVPSQLIRPSKFPTAAIPVALVRFLASVRPLVCLKMRALGVDLAAAGVSAAMHTFVSLRFGVIVDGIDQLELAVLGPSCHAGQHVREFLDGRRGCRA